jgi:tetratricopeptide (TPR) repeat protein
VIRPTREVTLVFFVLILLLAPLGLLAQDRKPGEFTAIGKEAFEASQKGDIEGAIALLEKHRQDESVTAVDLALLGALYLEVERPGDAFDVLNPIAEHPAADPALLYNAGRAADAVGQRPLAVDYYERSLRLLPVSPAGRELGLIYGAQKRISEAYRLLRPWAVQNPKDLEVRLATIACALELGRPSDAQPMFKGLPRESARVTLLLGQYLNQVGDPEGATKVLKTLLTNLPPEMEVDVWHLMASAYVSSGQADQAVELLAGKTDGRPRLALQLAEAYLRLGQHDQAVEVLGPMGDSLLDPNMPAGPLVFRIALGYGRALAAAGRHQDSLAFLEIATKINSEDSLAWKSLGDSLVRAGRREEAKVALARFRELSKGTAEERRQAETGVRDPVSRALFKAQEAIQAGKPQQALAILRQEIEISPRDVRPRILEVQVLIRLERKEEALKAADNALRAFPDLADTNYQIGMVLISLDHTEEARKAFRKALEIQPEHTAAMNDLAVLLMLAGERQEARQLLEQVLKLRPEDKIAKENLDRLNSSASSAQDDS